MPNILYFALLFVPKKSLTKVRLQFALSVFIIFVKRKLFSANKTELFEKFILSLPKASFVIQTIAQERGKGDLRYMSMLSVET